MDTNLNKETNDKQALDALIHCSEFYVLSFSNDTFFTEIAGGRKLLWCCASVADLAVIMKAAYADRVNDAIICTTLIPSEHP